MKYYISQSHKHKEKFSIVVEEYECFRPDNNKIDYIINNFARGCYNNYFFTFQIRRIYNIEMTNGDFVAGITSDKKCKKCSRETFYTKTNNEIF